MVTNLGGYILSAASHQAVSLTLLIPTNASDNTSCITVRSQAQDQLQTQALGLAAFLAILMGIHREIH